MTNKHIHDKPQLNALTRYQQYAEALASGQYARFFGGRFNGPHVLTDRHGGTARCCGTVEGCKWCANEAAYMGRPLAPPTVAAVEPSGFMECDTCRAKPGSPTLCAGCLHNRYVIDELRISDKDAWDPTTGRYIRPTRRKGPPMTTPPPPQVYSRPRRRRSTTNWLLELTPEEGELTLALVDAHRKADNHKDGYDHTCLLCRAGSRISLGRDYGWAALWPDTQDQILRSRAERTADDGL